VVWHEKDGKKDYVSKICNSTGYTTTFFDDPTCTTISSRFAAPKTEIFANTCQKIDTTFANTTCDFYTSNGIYEANNNYVKEETFGDSACTERFFGGYQVVGVCKSSGKYEDCNFFDDKLTYANNAITISRYNTGSKGLNTCSGTTTKTSSFTCNTCTFVKDNDRRGDSYMKYSGGVCDGTEVSSSPRQATTLLVLGLLSSFSLSFYLWS
jgi:hypothetical protein